MSAETESPRAGSEKVGKTGTALKGGWQVFFVAAAASIVIAVAAGFILDNFNTRVDEVPAVPSVRLN